MVQNNHESIGTIIKEARERAGVTVELLAEKAGITARYIYRIENEGKTPSLEVLRKLFRVLDADPNLYFYPEKAEKDSELGDLIRMLYRCDDRSIAIIRATVKAALESQEKS